VAQPSNREQLVKGAMKCLRTKGYARTTARDIAAASGANLASIGYHFGSKEALLNEAMIELFERRNWSVGDATRSADGATPLERLRAFFTASAAVFSAPRPLFIAFVEAIAQAGHSDELREQLAVQYSDMRRGAGELVRRILGESADRLTGDPEVLGAFILALLDGLVLQWLLDPEFTPKGEDLLNPIVEMMALVLEDERKAKPHAARRRSANVRRRGGTRA
jgi:AcrR family transcriptional regulator